MTAPHLHRHAHGQQSLNLTRRSFVTNFARTSFGLVVVGPVLVACSSDSDGSVAPDPSDSTSSTVEPSDTAAATTDAPGEPATEPAGEAAVSRALVDFGFVAAYVVARGGQATVIDTGVEGSADQIGSTLEQLGLGWGDVSDIILTHSHGDHIGSLAEAAGLATEAALWAGAADISAMTAPREITAVGDGDSVFGMDIITTPGHTPGHISVLDGTILFSGDALNGDAGAIVGPNSQFTPDMDTAWASVSKLAEFDYTQVNVSHGYPTTGGTAEVAALAASHTTG